MNLRCFAAALAACTAGTALASTGFHLGAGTTAQQPDVYAISTGWYYPVQGAAVVNARHVERTGELLDQPGQAVRWESRFGSVSATMNGVGFPMSGVNEKGLMIQATVLAKKPTPAVPAGALWLTPNGWIQYHLDTSGTVDEVVEKSVRSKELVMSWSPAKYNIQYQVCDRSGCAQIAYHDGKAVAQGSFGRVERDLGTGKVTVDAGSRDDLAAIANGDSEDGLSLVAKCKAGSCPGADDNQGQRLVIAADAVARHAGEKAMTVEALIPEVFGELEKVDQNAPLTTWNEAYAFDPATSRIRLFYKSPKKTQADLQWIDFSGADYDCHHPVRVYWLDMDHAGGDQTARFVPYSEAVQQRLVVQHGKDKGGYMPPKLVSERLGYLDTHTRCLSK